MSVCKSMAAGVLNVVSRSPTDTVPVCTGSQPGNPDDQKRSVYRFPATVLKVWLTFPLP